MFAAFIVFNANQSQLIDTLVFKASTATYRDLLCPRSCVYEIVAAPLTQTTGNAYVQHCVRMAVGRRLSMPANGLIVRLCQYTSFVILSPQGELGPGVALLGLLLEQDKAADVRGIAEKASTGLLVVVLPCLTATLARSFAATIVDERISDTLYRFGTGGAAERVVVGVDNALERNRGRCWRGSIRRIRRHCSAFFGRPDARR